MAGNQRSWIKPHFRNIVSSAENLDCLIAEANIEDAHIEMAKPYPALTQRHILVVRADTTRARLEWTNNGRRREDIFIKDDLILNPAGLTTFPRWNKPVRLFLLAICPEALNRMAVQMDVAPSVEFIPSYGFRDELLPQLVQKTVEEFSKEHPDLMYAETMAHAAMAHLLKTTANLTTSKRELQGRLPMQVQRRVTEYIQDNLGGRLKLADLASLAQLSPPHFARLFRQSTGVSPHQWLLEQRLAKAEDLLRNSKLTISEIATRTGFSDQSHLTRLFRRSRGVTPFQFRMCL